MKNIYASLFGESPETQQARENRNASFQAMLNSRKQAAEQTLTDSTKMARYNALGNVLTTMVQPLGWAAGGSTGGVQKYDDRQYIDSFNRAVKAADDLRNIGTAEDQYRFNLAEEDYKRQLALEDAERKRRQDLEDSERKYQFQLEKQQQQYQHQLDLQQQKDDARMQLEQYKQSHKVSKKGTGLSIDDRILLKEIDAYNKYVTQQENLKQPYDTFDNWMNKRGYQVTSVKSTQPANSAPSGGRSIDW